MKGLKKKGLLRLFLLVFILGITAPVFTYSVHAAQQQETQEKPYASVEDAKAHMDELSQTLEDANAQMEEAEIYLKEETVPLYATFWALVPPIVAIVLALITKEVYLSLFIGILTGALFYANFNIEKAITTMFSDGFVSKLSDSWNVGILIFLVILGVMVSIMNKVGGSAAYGKWASTKIKTRRGALLSTFGLGAFIFVDDYFNCLTVGSVMRPVTDKFQISRAKLAYIIDATAAPV